MDDVLLVTDRHGPLRITSGKRIEGMAVTVHCYRVGSVLVDAGPPNQVPHVLEALDEAGAEVTDLLLTHHHPDHVGAAHRLAERGATVWAHQDALGPLWQPPEPSERTRRLWGQAEQVDAEILGEQVTVGERTLQVVPTPGHSQDHVAFHDPEQGWIFTGDAYIGPRVALGPGERLDQLLESYRRICDLEPELMFPGHGAVVKDPQATLTKTIDHFEELRARAWDLKDDGLGTQAIADEMFGTEGRFASGRFTHRNLVAELLRNRAA